MFLIRAAHHYYAIKTQFDRGKIYLIRRKIVNKHHLIKSIMKLCLSSFTSHESEGKEIIYVRRTSCKRIGSKKSNFFQRKLIKTKSAKKNYCIKQHEILPNCLIHSD